MALFGAQVLSIPRARTRFTIDREGRGRIDGGVGPGPRGSTRVGGMGEVRLVGCPVAPIRNQFQLVPWKPAPALPARIRFLPHSASALSQWHSLSVRTGCLEDRRAVVRFGFGWVCFVCSQCVWVDEIVGNRGTLMI